MEFSLKRGQILSAIKENQPISVTKLAKIVNLSTGRTIYRYLDELKKLGLIEMKKAENKTNRKGNPTMLSITSKASPAALKNINRAIKISEEMKNLFK